MKRIDYIDISRGIAIILIVIGHTLVYSKHCYYLYKYIYSFHVVLFFIISGLTFKIKENVNFIEFTKKKAKRILLPYFIWSSIFLIPYIVLGKNVGNTLGLESHFNILEQIGNILYGNGNAKALQQNSSLWFLPALFSMEIIYYWIIKFVEKNKKMKLIVLSVLIAISYLCNYFFHIYLPWGINTALVLGIFFYIGYLLKTNNLLDEESYLFKPYVIVPMGFIGSIVCYFNKIVSCIEYKYGFLTFAIISGLSLSLVVIYIAKKIEKNYILQYIGKNTMGILVFHKIIILIFQTKLGIISRYLINSNILIEVGMSILTATISIGVSLTITKIICKIIPLSLGYQKQ